MDVDEIMKIPRLGNDQIDSVVWNFEDNGIFSVKSAYNLAIFLKDNRNKFIPSPSNLGCPSF